MPFASSIILLIVPVSYLFLRCGFPPEAVYVVTIVVLFVVHCVRLLLVRRLAAFFSIREYIRRAVIPCVRVALISSALMAGVMASFHSSLLLLCFSVMVPIATVYMFGMTSREKRFVYEKLISIIPQRK